MALSAVGLLREAERHAWQLVQSAQQVPAAAADDREQARQWHRERGDEGRFNDDKPFPESPPLKPGARLQPPGARSQRVRHDSPA